MSANNNNNSVTRSVKVKPVQPRYIVLNEDIFNALDIYETSVYLALRYLADYRLASSDVEIKIEDLIIHSKVKRRMLFYCLNSLEKKHFLIKRLNWDKGTFGKTNEYEVAQHLYYFKPVEETEIEEKNTNDININEEINGSYIEGVHLVHGVVHDVHTVEHPVHEMHTVKKAEYKETYYQQNEQKKAVLDISNLLDNNPHKLPIQMLEDWLCNRKAKKAPVTQTAWTRLNKELGKCKNPIEAFEECVSAGWLSFKHEWIDKQKGKESYFDHETTGWAKDLDKDMF